MRCRVRSWALVCVVLLLAACAGKGPSTPIADRPIDLSATCAQTEEDGFRENAQLTVRANRVEALSWQLWVGKRGSCKFTLADFRQVSTRPSIELTERSGGSCKLLIWQAPARVTLAHAGCEKFCNGGIYDKAWPVMFEPSGGGCAKQ